MAVEKKRLIYRRCIIKVYSISWEEVIKQITSRQDNKSAKTVTGRWFIRIRNKTMEKISVIVFKAIERISRMNKKVYLKLDVDFSIFILL